MNISEELNILNTAKQDIKSAIIEKGQTVGDNMHEYADAIKNISGGGEDTNDYLCFEAVEDSAISLSNYGGNLPNVEYSFDKQTWTVWDYSNIDILAGQKLYMRGDNPNGFNKSTDERSTFATNGNFSICGDLMAIIYKNGNNTLLPSGISHCFYALFYQNLGVVDISGLYLSSTNLVPSCCLNMFRGCSNLIHGIKELPIINLEESCYAGFYQDCINLVDTITILPATTLVSTCYQNMFWNCKKLKEAPYLPATQQNGVERTYGQMFRGCTSLQYIKCELQNINVPSSPTPSNCPTYLWVDGVPSTGCFIKAKGTSWTTKNTYACPSGWTLITSVS